MSTLLIRNISQELYANLEQSALLSGRSLSQEAIALLEKSLITRDIKAAKKRRKKIVEEISKNRKLTQEEAKRAIQWIRNDRDRP